MGSHVVSSDKGCSSRTGELDPLVVALESRLLAADSAHYKRGSSAPIRWRHERPSHMLNSPLRLLTPKFSTPSTFSLLTIFSSLLLSTPNL